MLKNEGNPFIEAYLQELTSMMARLYEIQAALETEDIEKAKYLIAAEITLKAEFSVVQQKVNTLFPEFVVLLNQALEEGEITKLMWQVGYCLKLGMTPLETSKVLPTTNRSVSVQATKLRKMGILTPVKK